MQRTVLAAAATLAILAGTALAPAAAMPAAPAGVAVAVTADPVLQDVAVDCHLVWRCGRYGCGWRRVCYRVAPRRYWAPRYYYRRHWHRW